MLSQCAQRCEVIISDAHYLPLLINIVYFIGTSTPPHERLLQAEKDKNELLKGK
jgi:hypothetical protein